MTTEESSALTLGFSSEEMFYLLDCLSAPELPGIDREPFSQLQEAQQKLALDVARRALLARQLLVPGDGGLQADPLVPILLGPNVAPEHSIIIWRSGGAEPERTYFAHSLKDVHVLRWTSALGIHQFVLVEDKAALEKSVLDLLALEGGELLSGPVSRIQAATFEQAKAAAAERGAAAAESLLRESRVPAETAAAVAAALAAPKALVSMAGMHHGRENSRSEFSFTVLKGDHGVWLIESPETDSDDQLTIRPSSASEVAQRIRAFVAAY